MTDRTLISSRARAEVPPRVGGAARGPHGEPPRGPDTERQRSLADLAREAWAMVEGHKGRLVVAMVGLTLSSMVALVPPAGTKFAIDYVFTDKPGPSGLPPELGLPTDASGLLWLLVGALLVVAAVQASLQLFANWEITRLQKRLASSLRRRAFGHAIHLPLHEAQKLKSGGVASLLRGDAGVIGDLIGSLVAGPWRALVKLTGTLLILASVDITLLLGAFVLFPLVVVSHRSWIAKIRPLWRDVFRERQTVDGTSAEAFAGLRVVRAFAREQAESRRFIVGTHALVRREVKVWWRTRAVRVVWALLVPAATTLLLLYGGHRVLDGELTLGDLMMFTTYLVMLLGPVEALVGSATQLQSSIAALDRVLELLSLPQEEETAGEPVGDAQGALTFEGVGFVYPGTDKPVLEDIDLDIAAGETVALVGPSGAGKTTLAHLAARFYRPTTGRLLLDGRPVEELSLADYRRLLAIVEQDVFLFDGTVTDNIVYGRPDASEADIRRACERAGALGFIEEMEQGFDTIIGERGVRLSGGQRQRLAIARALLAEPRLLILDEATSNLDAESEAHIQRALDELLEGRTCFIIAHRLSTVRSADRVIVLDKGRVVEQGTHEELLHKGGRYADLLAAQLDGQGARPSLTLAPAAQAG